MAEEKECCEKQAEIISQLSLCLRDLVDKGLCTEGFLIIAETTLNNDLLGMASTFKKNGYLDLSASLLSLMVNAYGKDITQVMLCDMITQMEESEKEELRVSKLSSISKFIVNSTVKH